MSFTPGALPNIAPALIDSTSHPHMFVIPDLISYCTLDLRVHEELPRAVWESKAWLINGSNISRNEKALNSFHGLKAGELACACYPLVPLRKLRVCADYVNWLWHMDDISDDMDERSTVAIENEVMPVYYHPDTYNPKTDVGKLAKSYWTRFIAEGSPGSQKRFVYAMELFFKAITTQARGRATGVIPNLDDFIVERRDTSGCRACWALIEYAGGLDLSDEVMEHPIIQSLEEATNDLVSWSNDIFSYNREQAKGHAHNIIAVMMHHHGMTLQEAVDFVGGLCKKSFDRFNGDRARLPSWGPEIDAQVQAYVQGLADWIIGTLHWSFDCERYFGKRGLQVKKSGVVELVPSGAPEPAAFASLSSSEQVCRPGL